MLAGIPCRERGHNQSLATRARENVPPPSLVMSSLSPQKQPPGSPGVVPAGGFLGYFGILVVSPMKAKFTLMFTEQGATERLGAAPWLLCRPPGLVCLA